MLSPERPRHVFQQHKHSESSWVMKYLPAATYKANPTTQCGHTPWEGMGLKASKVSFNEKDEKMSKSLKEGALEQVQFDVKEKSEGAIRIVLISDTHNLHRSIFDQMRGQRASQSS